MGNSRPIFIYGSNRLPDVLSWVAGHDAIVSLINFSPNKYEGFALNTDGLPRLSKSKVCADNKGFFYSYRDFTFIHRPDLVIQHVIMCVLY